jgi:Rrf2 family protein
MTRQRPESALQRSGTLNQTAEYALRAVLYLAGHGATEPVPVADIARAIDVPQNYLSKVLHVLAREGVLASQRGPRGGFRLRLDADRLTLGRVIGPFDPIEDRCLLMRRTCSDRTPCLAHHEWHDVAQRVRRFFRETTVAALLADDGRPVINGKFRTASTGL